MVFVLHGSWFVGNGHGHSHDHSHRPSHGPSHTQSLTEADSESFLMTEAAVPLKTTDKSTNGATSSQLTHEEKNLNLRAAMIHVIGDLVQSVGVFLAAVLIKIYPSAKYADPLCTVLFSIIVIITTVQLFRESLAILLNAVPLNLSLRALHCELASLDGVRSVHHLNVWQHTTQQRVMMVHLVTDSRSDRNEILQAATKLVSGPRYNVMHSTIQLEQASA